MDAHGTETDHGLSAGGLGVLDIFSLIGLRIARSEQQLDGGAAHGVFSVKSPVNARDSAQFE